MNTSQNPRTQLLIKLASQLYEKARTERKANQYVDFTCVVQGIQHVVALVQELPFDCLLITTVIEDGATYVIYAPADQVCFQVMVGEGEQIEPRRFIGFEPLKENADKV